MRIGIIVSGIIISCFFTGCFETKEKNDISCGDSSIKDLVYQLTEPQVKNDYAGKIFVAEKKKKNSDKNTLGPMTDMIMGEIGKMATMFLTPEEKQAIMEKVDIAFKDSKFSLVDTLTTKKDKELHLVECKADAVYTLSADTNLTYNVTYKGQLTDNLEKVYVEVLTFEERKK
ncbi:hypothetical protein [Sulfurospirillum cavolei]|uniref:hypothetical protein n=1 Tax=Sulfurospirillum cavolei TaxID=366522 RepID=UPI000764ADB1|nr:hypothetical protein [Sulfurospirillum cavolei]